MGYLLKFFAVLVLLLVTVAGAAEILGFSIGPLHGSRWVNVWQYSLAALAACLIIAFEIDDLVETGKETACLFSLPLLIWVAAGFFPAAIALWATDWGVLTQLFATIGLFGLVIYAIYLDVRYLMLPFFSGLFRSAQLETDVDHHHE